MLRTSGGARLLGPDDLDDVRALLARDPVTDVFVAARVEAAGLDPWRAGAETWGYGERGRLESLNLKQRGLEIVSCPSCGRAQVDVYTLAEQVTAGLEGITVPLRVAVMGCVVNGPGEAREADLGVASGNGKGQIFVKGEVIKTVPESQIVETLIEEALRIAEAYDGPSGEPAVGVS